MYLNKAEKIKREEKKNKWNQKNTQKPQKDELNLLLNLGPISSFVILGNSTSVLIFLIFL